MKTVRSWVQGTIMYTYKVAYGLSFGTKIGDLEWPWTSYWQPTRAISAVAELLVIIITSAQLLLRWPPLLHIR